MKSPAQQEALRRARALRWENHASHQFNRPTATTLALLDHALVKTMMGWTWPTHIEGSDPYFCVVSPNTGELIWRKRQQKKRRAR